MALSGAALARADVAEDIGLTAMRRERPAIVGSGIPVAQPEGSEATNAWQVNPVMNPAAFFTWTSDQGTATNFPNSVGLESGHADGVAYSFYATGTGMAPGVPRVDSYEAGYFIETVLTNQQPIAGRVINQSFILTEPSAPFDPVFDSYAATFDVLFVSGMNNVPDTPYAPGTAYNGIGVGIYSTNAMSSVGPTMDGRAKPDIVAPHPCCSSFTTPQVAGAAVLLLQAGAQNDGGSNTAALATNSITVKALLLNGAVKPPGWTNGVTRPLDARYGAGVLNIYNSDLQLRGRRHVAIATNNVLAGGAHPPTSHTNNVASLSGWDFSAIQNSVVNDRVAHYYFNLPTNCGAYSAAATLVWKKNAGPLSDLDLFLYDTGSNALVTNSSSTVDNVEHIFIGKFPAGRYDLQVLRRGGVGQLGAESYALAFDFSPIKVSVVCMSTNTIISWPASSAGFVLQTTPGLSGVFNWQTIGAGGVLSNSANTITLPASMDAQFFRLFRP